LCRRLDRAENIERQIGRYAETPDGTEAHLLASGGALG
jgi:hypothetical protein